MKKHGKKVDSKSETKELFKLTALQTPDYEAEAELDEAAELTTEADEDEDELRKKITVPKAAYRVAAILIALVLVLALWLNRDSLTPDNISAWVRLQFVGSEEGDGFPAMITGSSVFAGNFTAQNGNALVLSDTSLTMLSESGKSLLSLRHSFNEPVMQTCGSKTLLYNQGSVGYLLLNGEETVLDSATEQDILLGTVAQNGRYALATQGENNASELHVYQKDGTEQYQYFFARDYVTAIALNYDGTMGAVCTVRAEKGELLSRVVIFDFNQSEPIAEQQVTDNYLFAVSWSDGGDLYALGESAALLANSSKYEFTEYSYEGRAPTAVHFGQGKAFLSVSAYEHNGPSTLLVFDGKQEPKRIEVNSRILSLSSYGGNVAALADGAAYFFDSSTGNLLGTATAGSDAKGLALGSESFAYVLGVSELRTITVE